LAGDDNWALIRAWSVRSARRSAASRCGPSTGYRRTVAVASERFHLWSEGRATLLRCRTLCCGCAAAALAPIEQIWNIKHLC
jgi:hypothetical protein